MCTADGVCPLQLGGALRSIPVKKVGWDVSVIRLVVSFLHFLGGWFLLGLDRLWGSRSGLLLPLRECSAWG